MKVVVVYWDLKSINVFVRNDGISVILDFGLVVFLNFVEDESKNVS